MKLLLDTCVWGGALQELKAAGHEAIWAGEWDEDPGDEEILTRAHRESRILVTLDKDFGELAVVHGVSHSGILRLVAWPAQQQAIACLRALSLYGAELEQGAMVTAERGRFRIRLP